MDLFIADRNHQSTLANVITDCCVVAESEKSQWSEIVGYCVESNITDKESWIAMYERAELENVTLRIHGGEDVKLTKAGKPVASKAFGKSWNTNKAVIGKALETGVPIMVDGVPVPKSQLEKDYKAALKSKAVESEEGAADEKSDFEKAKIVVGTLEKLYNKLSVSEQAQILELVNTFK